MKKIFLDPVGSRISVENASTIPDDYFYDEANFNRPKLFRNLINDFPEEFTGEAIVENSEEYPEEQADIEKYITSAVEKASKLLQGEELVLFTKDLRDIERAFGLRQSLSQMSNLDPAKVVLKVGYPTFRSERYHLSEEEEEESLELKMNAIEKALLKENQTRNVVYKCS